MNKPLDHAELEIGRIQPHNIELEQQVLGALLISNDAFHRIEDIIKAEHFFSTEHQRIFECIGKLIRGGREAKPVTVKTFFEHETIAEIPAAEYIARLAVGASTIINAVDYAEAILELAMRRTLISIGGDMVDAAYEPDPDNAPKVQVEAVEKRLYQLAENGKTGQGFVPFNEALGHALEMAEAAHKRSGRLSGISTGLKDVDELLGGLQRSDLVILAGRPAMGKTSLATNIAFAIAKDFRAGATTTAASANGGRVGFFSLEMSAEQLATRILAEQSGISSSLIRRGAINYNQFNDLVEATSVMSAIPFHIDQTGGLTINQLAARARRLKRTAGLDVLIVDYLQLLAGSGKRASDSRVQEITEITTGLKALAKELNVPIVALSQLSRQVENREDKRPQLADLRESGSIEQDADVVLFVYREEYYLQNRKPPEGSPEFVEWSAKMEGAHGTAELIVGKQRHGPTGTVKLQFDAEVTRFSNLATGDAINLGD